MYHASIRWVAQWCPSVHWVKQWHSSGIPVYTGPASVHWRRVRDATFLYALQWRHNEYDGVSNHRRPDCLFNRLLWRRSKELSKLRVTDLCVGNPPVTDGFPHKGPVENVSIWVVVGLCYTHPPININDYKWCMCFTIYTTGIYVKYMLTGERTLFEITNEIS